MKIVVPVKLVPDLVEELVVDESGAKLDALEFSLCLNEFDDHALEQAVLLKERGGGEITVIAPDMEEANDVLYSAAAKNVDQLIKLAGVTDENMSNHAYARMLTPVIKELSPDLVLTGVQAHDDLDGQLGPLLAEYLKLPYVGYVAGVDNVNGKAIAFKEYPGGLLAKMEVTLPAVLGIQAAEQPPRYIAFSRIRQAMSTASIEERATTDADHSGVPEISQLYPPIAAQRAEMLEGEADEIAAQLLSILAERGFLQRGH